MAQENSRYLIYRWNEGMVLSDQLDSSNHRYSVGDFFVGLSLRFSRIAGFPKEFYPGLTPVDTGDSNGLSWV